MAKTLDDKIREAEQQIIKTQFKYEVYATAIRDTYEKVEKVDPESIPLLWDLIKTMERIPSLDTELKQYILGNIREVALDAETSYEYRRKRIIQNLRRGIKMLTNEKGLLKMNELYSLALAGKIFLRDFDEYLEEIRDRAYDLDQETQIRYARQKVAYDYLKVIIKGLLIDPTKYEPLYKQFIETDDLGEFVLNLPEYI
jgi:predicted transcriptional regulator